MSEQTNIGVPGRPIASAASRGHGRGARAAAAALRGDLGGLASREGSDHRRSLKAPQPAELESQAMFILDSHRHLETQEICDIECAIQRPASLAMPTRLNGHAFGKYSMA